MSYSEIVETTETHRVRIVAMEDSYGLEPDGDGQGVFIIAESGRWGNWNTELKHHDGACCGKGPHGEPLDSWKREAVELDLALHRALNHAEEHGLSDVHEFAERHLRAFYGAVSIDYITWGSGRLYNIVTQAMVERWGVPAELVAGTAAQGLVEWQAYGEGDVWGYVVEERQKWVRLEGDTPIFQNEDGSDGVREEWNDTDDSCWGYYGQEYAEEAAREALATYKTEEAA